MAGLGFDTLAFDVAPTAVRAARRRFPESRVDYVVADLLDPPPAWRDAFDLVVECITIQSMPVAVRAEATANVAAMVAPGGTLIVVSGVHESGGPREGPPWPLTRAEVEAFAGQGLTPVEIELVVRAGDARWRAEFRR